MPLPAKQLPPGYELADRRESDPYVYVRPDGSRSRAYDRRIRMTDAAWVDWGIREVARQARSGSGGDEGGTHNDHLT